MPKVYTVVEARTKRQVYTGTQREWDVFYGTHHSRLGTIHIETDTRSKKVILVYPPSPKLLLSAVRRLTVKPG